VSGNPGGRPKKTDRERSFEEVCRQKAVEHLGVIEEAVLDNTAPWKERLTAYQMLAENGFGKAVDRIAIQALSGSAGRPQMLSTADLLSLSDSEILAIGESGCEVVSEQ
jgi:hypothetical protein